MALLVQLVVVLLVLGILYYVLTAIPLPPVVRAVATGILALLACFWLLDVAGLLPSAGMHLRR